MTQLWSYAFIGVLLLCSAINAEAIGQDHPSSPNDRPNVEVFITASGKDGSPEIPSISDLNVSVDKRPAIVASLRSAKEDKLVFAILVDVSKSQTTKSESIKGTATQISQALSVGGNRGYLVVFNHQLGLSKTPLQPAKMREALDRIHFGGGTAVYDAISETCTQILGRSTNPDAPRRVIILLSDGDDNQSHITPAKAEEIAEQEGIAVFSVSAGSAGSKGEEFLKELSRNTGGEAMSARKLEDGVAPTVAAINGQLALSLSIAETPDEKPHSFAIKNSSKEVHLEAPAHIFIK